MAAARCPVGPACPSPPRAPGWQGHQPLRKGLLLRFFSVKISYSSDYYQILALGLLAHFLSWTTCWMTSSNLNNPSLTWISLLIFYFVIEKELHIKYFIFYCCVFSRHQSNKRFCFFDLIYHTPFPFLVTISNYFSLLTQLDIKLSQDQYA